MDYKSEPALRVQDVHYAYPENASEPIPALRGVSLTVQPGEYVAIIGANGSGKSTLARHLNGLLLPAQGHVWVGDWDTRDARHQIDVRRTVGMVFQSPDDQIVATIVEEDVAFGPENLGVPRADLVHRVDRALDTVEMQPYRQRAPHLLSGGQKQRVALAGVLAMQPRILVLDEATALLDPAGRAEVLQVVLRLHRDGTTIVAITHFMSEAALAERVIVMDRGRVVLDGTPREVFAQAERLDAWQLAVPEITQLAQRLHARCGAFPGDVLSVDEFVAAVQARVSQRRSRIEGPIGLPAEPPPPGGERVIDVRNLTHTYLRGTPLESSALRGVDMTVRRGEIVGIIGHTGSGKSTLIQHLNGLVRPQHGEVTVLGHDLAGARVDGRALRRQVGLAFQFPEAQLFEQYVGDDVAFGPWQMGLRGEALAGRVRDAMDAVGLSFDAFKDRPLHALSGGERRRAALAGVLALRPEILILDEPTAGLDPRGHQDVLERLVTLARARGTTLLMVSHNMEDIAAWCDRVYVLADGRTVQTGTPRQVFGQTDSLERWGLGVPQVTAAMHALGRLGLPVCQDALTVAEAENELIKVLDG